MEESEGFSEILKGDYLNSSSYWCKQRRQDSSSIPICIR